MQQNIFYYSWKSCSQLFKSNISAHTHTHKNTLLCASTHFYSWWLLLACLACLMRKMLTPKKIQSLAVGHFVISTHMLTYKHTHTYVRVNIVSLCVCVRMRPYHSALVSLLCDSENSLQRHYQFTLRAHFVACGEFYNAPFQRRRYVWVCEKTRSTE